MAGEVIRAGLEKISKLLSDMLENEIRLVNSLLKINKKDTNEAWSVFKKIKQQALTVLYE